MKIYEQDNKVKIDGEPCCKWGRHRTEDDDAHIGIMGIVGALSPRFVTCGIVLRHCPGCGQKIEVIDPPAPEARPVHLYWINGMRWSTSSPNRSVPHVALHGLPCLPEDQRAIYVAVPLSIAKANLQA